MVSKKYCIKITLALNLFLLISFKNVLCAQNNNTNDKNSGFNECNAELKLNRLLVKTIKSHCQEVDTLKADRLHSDTICNNHLNVVVDAHVGALDAQSICTNTISSAAVVSDQVCANHLNVWKEACVGTLDAQSVCTNHVSSQDINSDFICTKDLNVANQLCASEVVAQVACVNNLVANDACINNLKVGALQQCGKYRATMTFAANQSYTLGDIVEWDTILDDPNNNISFIPNAQYTAPLSGYYTILLQLDQDNIQGADVILGTPVANLELLVNGTLFRQTFVPFLTFHNEQKATVSGLLSLNAGDVVTSRFRVLVMADGVGLTDYVGTVNILGTGIEENGSVFKIHLLSVDCLDLPCVPCITGASGSTGCFQECPEVCVPCQPIPCIPCTPIIPEPCSCVSCPIPCCTPCIENNTF